MLAVLLLRVLPAESAKLLRRAVPLGKTPKPHTWKNEGGAGYSVRAFGATRRYTSSSAISITAVDEVDLELSPGSVTALTGPSGSGKSTLLHLIGGMDRLDAGSIQVADHDLGSMSRKELVSYRRTIGFVFQQFALLPALTAEDNVMLPVLPNRTMKDRRSRARELLSDVGLSGREDSLPHQLSGGQQQRVAIARALMNRPRMLLADEPTGNLDTTTGAEVFDLILSLRDSHGLTVVLATHDPALAQQCDSILQLRDGRLAA